MHLFFFTQKSRSRSVPSTHSLAYHPSTSPTSLLTGTYTSTSHHLSALKYTNSFITPISNIHLHRLGFQDATVSSRTRTCTPLIPLTTMTMTMTMTSSTATTDHNNIKTCLVTGSTDGIGLHTATNLARNGYRVILHGRSQDKCVGAITRVRAKIDPDRAHNIDYVVADLAHQAQIQDMANLIHEKYNAIDVLINNAGVFVDKRQVTNKGHELTFAVNVIAPYLITGLLMDLLKNNAQKGRDTRIIQVSSISHTDGSTSRRGGTIDFANLQYEKDYDRYGAYGLSKLCMIMLTYKQAELLAKASTTHPYIKNITVNTLDPGTVNTKMLLAGWGPCGIRVDQANDQTLLATDPALKSVTGKYFVHGREYRSAAQTYDPQIRDKLWTHLEQLTAYKYNL